MLAAKFQRRIDCDEEVSRGQRRLLLGDRRVRWLARRLRSPDDLHLRSGERLRVLHGLGLARRSCGRSGSRAGRRRASPGLSFDDRNLERRGSELALDGREDQQNECEMKEQRERECERPTRSRMVTAGPQRCPSHLAALSLYASPRRSRTFSLRLSARCRAAELLRRTTPSCRR